MGEHLFIEVPEGRFRAYLARPSAFPAPIMLVVQDVYGVDAHVREACDELAACGYLAISPDLYWRIEPGIELSDRHVGGRERAFAMYRSLDQIGAGQDIAATMQAARALPESDGRVGMVAYSLGGLAGLLAGSGPGTFMSLLHRRPNAGTDSDRATCSGGLLLIHETEDVEGIPPAAGHR